MKMKIIIVYIFYYEFDKDDLGDDTIYDDKDFFLFITSMMRMTTL